MAPLKSIDLPSGFDSNGPNILFVNEGEFKGEYLHVVEDSYGNIEVYHSPSIFRNSGLDGNPNQSFFPVDDDVDISELFGCNNPELVFPTAWGKWEYFFGISRISTEAMLNIDEIGVLDVFLPVRGDHFRSVLDLFDGDFKEHLLKSKPAPRADDVSWLRKRNLCIEFVRLFLLSKGLTLFVAAKNTKVLWVSDNYEGAHILGAERLATSCKLQDVQSQNSNDKFLDIWVEAKTVLAHLPTLNLLQTNMLSEESFIVWYKSSPIHKMRLGLNFFEHSKAATESYKYLSHLLDSNFIAENGVTYSLALAPWHGRTLLVQ